MSDPLGEGSFGEPSSGSGESAFVAQLGRISGKLLQANLERNGADLSFRNGVSDSDILYLAVNDARIGINTDAPSFDLEVNSSIKTLYLQAPSAIIDNFTMSSNQISTLVGDITVIPAGPDPTALFDRMISDDLVFDGNVISSTGNQNIEFDPNALGTIELQANTNVTGDIYVTGNIAITGDLSKQGDIIIGDDVVDLEGNLPENDTVDFRAPISQDLLPGANNAYDLGGSLGDSTAGRWAEIWSPDWTNIVTLTTFSAVINNQMLIDGVNNEIKALQGNDNLVLNPDTGILYVEELKFSDYEWNLGYTLDNPNAFGTSASDSFGHSVAISGDRCIVGAYFEDDAGGTNSGKAYIFDTITGTLLHTLNNPNAYGTSADDVFGISVAIDGDRCIVGARAEDEPGIAAAGINSGKAYVFDVTSGSLLYTLDNPNAFSSPSSDSFGNKVAISGDRCIVGVQDEDDAGGSSSGKAYLFDLTSYSSNTYNVQFEFGRADDLDGTFTIDLVSLGIPIGELGVSCNIDSIDIRGDLSSPSIEYIDLKLSTSASYDRYTSTADDATYRNKTWLGARVNLNTSKTFNVDYIIPPGVNFSPSGMPSGFYWQVRFNLTVTTMSGVTVLDNPNAYSVSAADRFGRSVAISGDRCIVGAYTEGDSSGFSSGKAYIFDATDGSLLHTLDNPNAFGTSSADFFGWSVAISGNRAIVGAYQEDDAGGSGSGKAYIFDVSTGALVHTLDNPTAFGTSAGDEFGYSVGIDGDRAIVGALGEDDAGGGISGKAYIFDVTTGALVHILDNPTAFGTSADDRFGVSVDIDGDRAIVGAVTEDDAGGISSGKAYVFENTLNQSIIKNLNPTTPVQFASTGEGYLRFMGTNAVVIPAGDNASRPGSPEVGDTRWNTEEQYLECFDGTVYNIATGGGAEVTNELMSDLGNVYSLILG